jgi:hypothetical protein
LIVAPGNDVTISEIIDALIEHDLVLMTHISEARITATATEYACTELFIHLGRRWNGGGFDVLVIASSGEDGLSVVDAMSVALERPMRTLMTVIVDLLIERLDLSQSYAQLTGHVEWKLGFELLGDNWFERLSAYRYGQRAGRRRLVSALRQIAARRRA